MDFNKAVIGLELGSTRIKTVLLDENHIPAASGSYEWENELKNNIWTYSMDKVFEGIRECYLSLKRDVMEKFGVKLTKVGGMGISAMMHGYLVFDKNWNQLCEFRTWRNTITGPAADELTEKLDFNIPQRWSVAHIYQAILNGESHIPEIAHLTTLSGYIHFLLTGTECMGIGEASGMFPVDSSSLDYDRNRVDIFNSILKDKGISWTFDDIMPRIAVAGDNAGYLTEKGALLLDPEGDLKPGIPFCPCEGDAGTGMVATNSVRVYTGNVSAGTSDFAMVVVDRIPKVHREIDMVTTPAGMPVAMVHCNNCTSDINAWVGLFGEFAETMGFKIDKNELYTKLFKKAMDGDKDCGGLLSYNYFAGEGILNLDEGRPLFARKQSCDFTLANFMRTHLYSALATLKLGMDILTSEESVRIDKIYGHGGYFKTPEVGQRFLSAAIGSTVSVMETAGEGGPYGMALLAAFMIEKEKSENLEDYLDNRIFATAKHTDITATEEEIKGFNSFIETYKNGLSIEKESIRSI